MREKWAPPGCLLRKPRMIGQQIPGFGLPEPSRQAGDLVQSKFSCTPATAQSPSLENAALEFASGDDSPTKSVLLLPSVISRRVVPPRKYEYRQSTPRPSTEL